MTTKIGAQPVGAVNGSTCRKPVNVWSSDLPPAPDDVDNGPSGAASVPAPRGHADDVRPDFEPVTLSTGHQLRLRTLEDTPDFYRLTMCALHRLRQFEAWPHTYRFVGDEYRYTMLLVKAWQQGSRIPLGIFDTSGPVGALVAHLARDRRSATISYWLAGHATGKGVATAAVTWLVEELFEAWNVDSLEIHTLENNSKSQAVAERCGFTLATTRPYESAHLPLAENQWVYVRHR